jgi:predicted RNA methylase
VKRARRSDAKATRRRGPRLGVQRSRSVQTAGGAVGQWWSPAWLAHALCAFGRVEPGLRVIDLGAGAGALTRAALEHMARVTAVEVDERWVRHLEQMRVAHHHALSVVHGDVLARRDSRQTAIATGYAHDLAITNPPWEGDMVERFLDAGLELAPRVVAIAPASILFGGRRQGAWRTTLEPVRAVALAKRPKFGGKGGGMRDVILLEVARRALPLPPGAQVVLPLELR